MPILHTHPSSVLLALRFLHAQALLVIDFDYDHIQFDKRTLFASRHSVIVDPQRKHLAQLRLAIPTQAALLASLTTSHLSPLLSGHTHSLPEALNGLYALAIDRAARNTKKDSTLAFRTPDTFRRKLSSHFDQLLRLFAADVRHASDLPDLNVQAADYFVYLSFLLTRVNPKANNIHPTDQPSGDHPDAPPPAA